MSAGSAAIHPKRGRDWDAVAAVVATLVGLLALLVSGYTAYVQRQQVRAQVWPYLLIGWSDVSHSLVAINKGTGPAIIRSVRVRVDERAQPDWEHVLAALGTPNKDFAMTGTMSVAVFSPGEQFEMITLDEGTYRRFYGAARARLGWEVCFCSTLGDCWVNNHMPGQRPHIQPSSCPVVPAAQAFRD